MDEHEFYDKRKAYIEKNRIRVNASKSWWKFKENYELNIAKEKMRIYCEKKEIPLDQFYKWFQIDIKHYD